MADGTSKTASPVANAQPAAPRHDRPRHPPNPADPLHLELLNRSFPYGGVQIQEEELRGISLRQLRRVVTHVTAHCHTWRHTATAKLLTAESIDFYQLVEWMVRPATEEDDISFAELVAVKEDQKPQWFVIHWWGESVLGCWQSLESHVEAHSDGVGEHRLTEDTAYWQYAYAARLNSLFDEGLGDPTKASFFRAASVCSGALLVMNGASSERGGQTRLAGLEAPFTRTWCLMEIWTAVFQHGRRLDFAAYRCEIVDPDGEVSEKDSGDYNAEDADEGAGLAAGTTKRIAVSAEIVTEGLTAQEKHMERKSPGSGTQHKASREAAFPLARLEGAMSLEMEGSFTTEEEDRVNILNHVCGREDLSEEPLLYDHNYTRVNKRLRSMLAVAAWPHIVRTERAPSPKFVKAVAADHYRAALVCNFQDCVGFDDPHLSGLAQGINHKLQQIDLRLRGCTQLTDSGLNALSHALPDGLQSLRLDLRGCVRIGNHAVKELAHKLPSKLTDLYLAFDGCLCISGEGATYLAERLPFNLKTLYLDLSNTDRIDDPVAMAIGQRFQSDLKCLHLLFRGCKRMTDEACERLAERIPSSLQMLRLSFAHCKKVTDAGVAVIAKHIPQHLLMLNVDLEGCPDITDEGADALADAVPSTVSRISISLSGTGVRAERQGVTRRLATVRKWHAESFAHRVLHQAPASPLLPPEVTSRASLMGRPSLLATLFVPTPAPPVSTSPSGFRLPTVGLRIGSGVGDGVMVAEDNRTGDVWTSGLLAPKGSPASSNRSPFRSDQRGPRWRPHGPPKESLGPCCPRWVAAALKASPESMFAKSKSSPEIRRLVGHTEPLAWVP